MLDRSKSTIGRELERNCWRLKCRKYRSEVADGVAKKRRRHERKSRISGEIWQKIFEFYNEDWSPEQISGALKLRGICVSHETIYRRIYGEIRAGRLDKKHLRWNRPKRRYRLAKRRPRDLTKISIESFEGSRGGRFSKRRRRFLRSQRRCFRSSRPARISA